MEGNQAPGGRRPHFSELASAVTRGKAAAPPSSVMNSPLQARSFPAIKAPLHRYAGNRCTTKLGADDNQRLIACPHASCGLHWRVGRALRFVKQKCLALTRFRNDLAS